MYLGELAPKNLRGTLGTMTEVFVIVGVFLAQIFSLQAILGNPTGTHTVHAKVKGEEGPGGRVGPWALGPVVRSAVPCYWWIKPIEAEW